MLRRVNNGATAAAQPAPKALPGAEFLRAHLEIPTLGILNLPSSPYPVAALAIVAGYPAVANGGASVLYIASGDGTPAP